MYCLQHSAFCRLILVLVKLQYHAISSIQRQVCVRSLHMVAVVAMRTTLKYWRSAINSATLIVNSTIIIMMFVLELYRSWLEWYYCTIMITQVALPTASQNTASIGQREQRSALCKYCWASASSCTHDHNRNDCMASLVLKACRLLTDSTFHKIHIGACFPGINTGLSIAGSSGGEIGHVPIPGL